MKGEKIKIFRKLLDLCAAQKLILFVAQMNEELDIPDIKSVGAKKEDIKAFIV